MKLLSERPVLLGIGGLKFLNISKEINSVLVICPQNRKKLGTEKIGDGKKTRCQMAVIDGDHRKCIGS